MLPAIARVSTSPSLKGVHIGGKTEARVIDGSVSAARATCQWRLETDSYRGAVRSAELLPRVRRFSEACRVAASIPAPVLVENRPQCLIEVLRIAEEGLAQDALLDRSDFPEGTVTPS